MLSNGYIVTNEHVVRECIGTEVLGFSSYRQQVTFSKMIVDLNRDLCILYPTNQLEGGLTISDVERLEVGSKVFTWGFPLGYNGPSPLLSVGYLAGFIDHSIGLKVVKHLVVNGAFNPGNSGGPLFLSNDSKVIGVVSSKHAPISNYLLSAIQALASNKSGFIYTATDSIGNTKEFPESKLVADVLLYFRELTQVMIGEAIPVNEVIDLCIQNDIPLAGH